MKNNKWKILCLSPSYKREHELVGASHVSYYLDTLYPG